MSYLFNTYWAWMLAVLALGLLVGWLARAPAREAANGWFWPVLVVCVVALLVAIFCWIPGRPGLWLETALLLVLPYLLGCAAGCVVWNFSAGAEQDFSAPRPIAPAAPAIETRRPPVPAALGDAACPPPEMAPAPLAVDTLAIAARPEAPEQPDPGVRPAGMPRPAHCDDLKIIEGVGRRIAGYLNELDIWTFDQIAAWTPGNVKWLDDHFGFPGRIDDERWIEQAKLLAECKKRGEDPYPALESFFNG